MSIGYDKLSTNSQILLDLPFDEGVGDFIHDLAKPHHQFATVGPPVWSVTAGGIGYLEFGGVADFLECLAADSLDVNFTTEDFTLMAWINNPLLGGAQLILNQGEVDVDGWEFFLFGTNISLRTNQAAAHTDISAVAALTASVWQLVAVTRQGASGQFYVNGVAVTTTLGAGLADAVTCAGGNKLLVGVQDNEITNFFQGMMARPRIWARALTDVEISEIFQRERGGFGV